MLELTSGWTVDVERGPDWLIVRPHGPDELERGAPAPHFGESLTRLLDQHGARRMVIECEELSQLNSPLIGQLVSVQKHLAQRGGLLRLSGLSQAGQDALRSCRLDGLLPHFANRVSAIHGKRSDKPR